MSCKYASKWRDAAERHIKEVEDMGTSTWVLCSDVSLKDQILPLKWVFVYKFDEEGYILSFKARFVVRGVLQVTEEETYAATLAGRAFRLLMAIAAAFDLDLAQRDAKSAFTNARQPVNVYCHAPEGFPKPGYYMRLERALWGLKTSPKLWYNNLTTTLEKLGLHRIPGSPCIYHNKEILCFFVDDVILGAKPRHRRQLD